MRQYREASQTLRQPATSELALSLELESRPRFGLRTELDQAQGPLRLVHLEHAVRMPRHDATQPLPLALHVPLVLLLAPRTNKVLAAPSRAARAFSVLRTVALRNEAPSATNRNTMLPQVAGFGRKVAASYSDSTSAFSCPQSTPSGSRRRVPLPPVSISRASTICPPAMAS